MSVNFFIVGAICAAPLLLAGCGTTPSLRDADRAATRVDREAADLLKQGSAATLAAKPVEAKMLNYWIGARAVVDPPRKIMPFDGRTIVLKGVFASLAEVAESITRDTGITTRVSRENISTASEPLTFDYSGPLAPALDAIAARYGVYWKEVAGSVTFALTDTRVYYLRAVGNEINNQVSVSGDQGAGSTSGTPQTSDQKTTLSAQLSSFRAVEDTVRAMLSPAGKVVATPAGGTITVTDVPDVLDRVAFYLEKQDAHLGRQIAFDVRVFAVTLSKSDDYGFDWNALYSSLSGNYGVRLLAAGGAAASASSFALSIPQTASGRTQPWIGSELIAKALSDQGKVSQVTSATLRTANNKPVQYRRGNSFSYIPRSGSTSTANVGVTTTAETARERVGFSLNVIPNAFEDGNVMMQVTMRLSTLRQLRRIQQGQGTSQTTIEAPEIDENEFVQQAMIRSGETMVLAGFEQMTDSLNQSGVGSAANTLLGGERGKNARDVIVVTITPAVLEKG